MIEHLRHLRKLILSQYPIFNDEYMSRIASEKIDFSLEEIDKDVYIVNGKKQGHVVARYMVPAQRIMHWKGKDWVSPLIFLPHEEDWKKSKVDYTRGIYVPAYMLSFIKKMYFRLLSDKSTEEIDDVYVIDLMPSVGTERVKVYWDVPFVSTSFPVWYDITDENAISQISYKNLVILPLFAEHDVLSYRKYRAVNPTQKGILCPVHTPESKKMGFYLYMAHGASYDEQTFSIVPAEDDEKQFSTAVLHVPYFNYSDAPRVMMGAKNYKQAVKVDGAEEPVISTGYETEALGKNALVVYGLYKGYTIEDGIVVSRSFAQKMKHLDVVTVSIDIGEGMLKTLNINVKVGDVVKPWQVIAEYRQFDKKKKVYFPSFAPGRLKAIRQLPDRDFLLASASLKPDSKYQLPVTVVFEIEVERPLRVGDKLTGRHGNKGVVSKIVDDKDMPHVYIDGKYIPADVVMTPLGVISRKNIGALIETSFSVAKKHGLNVKMGPYVQLETGDIEAVRKKLQDLGADRYGRFKVYFGGKEFYALAGYQYILRLHHHAETKLSVRGKDGPVNIFGQPVGGRQNRGGQRLGEMEIWTLMSHGKKDVFHYVMSLAGKDRAWETYRYLLLMMGVSLSIKGNKVTWSALTTKTAWKKHIKHVRSVDKIGDKPKLYQVKDEKGYYIARYLWPYFFPRKLYERRSGKAKPIINSRFNIVPKYVPKVLSLYGGMTVDKKSIKDDKVFRRHLPTLDVVIGYAKAERSSKYGLFRRYVLGKRLNCTGRAVIVPDPTLDLTTIRIPRVMYEEFGGKGGKPIWVLLGRQPSLHKHSIQAFKAVPWDEYAIAVSPMICSGFGADFDGDTMWLIHVRDSKRLKASLNDMTLLANFYLLRNGEPAVLFGHDYAWGYFLEHGGDIAERVKRFIVGDSANMPRVDRNNIRKLEKSYFSAEHLENSIKDLHRYLDTATYYPPSFTFFMLYDAIHGDQNALQFILLLPLSGARGGEDAVSELVEGISIDEKTASTFMVSQSLSPFAKGLTSAEVWAVAYRGRNSMMDKKLTVASSGATTREMVYKLAHLKWKDIKDIVTGYVGDIYDPSSGEPFDDNFPIGVCTGQVLGERATQLAMKTFHTGAQAQSGALFKQFLESVAFDYDGGDVKEYLISRLPRFVVSKVISKDIDISCISEECLRNKVPNISADEINDILAKYNFLKKLIDSFIPMWLVIALVGLKMGGKETYLSQLAYSSGAIKDLFKALKEKKEITETESNTILQWLGVIDNEA